MYQALYRKYRPSDFNSVVGQNPIIRTLKNSVINHNFSHAYMFFGPRGTGKTSVSKIFARSINCLAPRDGEACGMCDCCRASFSKNCVDIIEIDAASNNGVDEIRELKNKISFVPSELKFKVYIIDEVHMLSIGAFNALLKTLEEPPEHAVFILATTDPQKVPETIVSRCQCFSFKRLSSDIIKNKLDFVCNKESIEIDSEVLENIALLSDGGLRDALGLLDKLFSYSSGKISMEDFVEVNGIVSDNQIDFFLKSVLEGNIENVIRNIASFENDGKNLVQVFNQILNYIRNLIVNYYLNDIDVLFSITLLQNFANLMNEKLLDIKKSSNTRIFMELFFLKFINDFVLPLNDNSFAEKKNLIVDDDTEKCIKNKTANKDAKKIEDVDTNFNDNSKVSEIVKSKNELNLYNSYEPVVLNLSEIIAARVNNTLALANKKLLNEELKNFEKLKEFVFDQDFGYIACALLDSKVRAVSEKNMIISFEYASNVKQNLFILDKIVETYFKITKSYKNIAIITDDEWNRYKNEYIDNVKKGIKYEVVEEPKEILEENENNDIISNKAIELFGDIVEIE